MSFTLSDGTNITENTEPYFVAELNTSHFGNVEIAKEMILKAKEVGADCVKFQSWTPSTLYSEDYYEENPIAKRFIKKYSFNNEELKTLALFCHEHEMGFSSTPYSESEVDFLLDECDAKFIKIASMDLNNLIFLEYIGKKGGPIILSTGMGSEEEIIKAVTTIKNTGNNNICILHCVSIYPAPEEIINLNYILRLRELFPDQMIGYSDHSTGEEAPLGSVALGACLIERHFTLDSGKIGMDNQMSTEPEFFERIISKCKKLKTILGKPERVVSVEEMEQRVKMRRSIVAKDDLKQGQVITEEMICAKRPGSGIAADKFDDLIGKKVKKNVFQDRVLYETDIE